MMGWSSARDALLVLRRFTHLTASVSSPNGQTAVMRRPDRTIDRYKISGSLLYQELPVCGPGSFSDP